MSVDNLYNPTENFSRKLEKIRQADPPGHRRILQVIDRLIAQPDDADGKMQGLYRGRYKKYVGRKDYRVIYYWCKLCKKENRRLKKECINCESIPDNSVIFFDIYHKNEMKNFKKKS